MQVTETLRDGLKRSYQITLPASDLDAKVNAKLEEARKDFQMKGFRKGKAPVALMKKMFGKSVLGEAMQESIDDAMRRHFEDTKDRPAQQPDVKMTNEDWQEGQDVEVQLSYEALPDVPEVEFKALELERLVVEIDEDAVGEALDNLSRSANHFVAKAEDAEAADGDQVVIDFEGRVDGELFEGGAAEAYPLLLGSGGFIPGFEEQLVGAKSGESREVTVTFPEEYQATHLAGKEAVFAVTVKEVKAPEPAPIDDELAKKFGVDDLETLNSQIREQLGKEYAGAARMVMKRKLMDALDEKVSFELPPTLVEVEANQIARQLWREANPEPKEGEKPDIVPEAEHISLAERRVRLGLLLADVGGKAQVTVSDQEMQQAMIAQARQYRGQEREFLEFLQKNPGAQQQIRAPIFEDKVVDYIVELATVTETTVSKEALEEAVKALDEDDVPTAEPDAATET
ncbi:MAG: trigger factor [Pseudomonadota bacterium]